MNTQMSSALKQGDNTPVVLTDFIAIVAKAQEIHGHNNKCTMIEVCAALKKEISRLSPEDIEPYLKSADINVKDLSVEITLAFPIESKILTPLQSLENLNTKSTQDKKVKEHTDCIELDTFIDGLTEKLGEYIDGMKNTNKNNTNKAIERIEKYEENVRNAAAKAKSQEENQVNINPDCYVSREIMYQTAVLKNIECLLRQLLIK